MTRTQSSSLLSLHAVPPSPPPATHLLPRSSSDSLIIALTPFQQVDKRAPLTKPPAELRRDPSSSIEVLATPVLAGHTSLYTPCHPASSEAGTSKLGSERACTLTPGSVPPRPQSRHTIVLKTSPSLRSVSLRSPGTGRRIRNAELHPGSNRFFCRGRLTGSGDHCMPLVLSSLCAVGLPLAFLGTNARWLCSGEFAGNPHVHKGVGGTAAAAAGGKAIVAIYSYVFMIMLSSMFVTSWTDPGIIPRGLDPDPEMEWLDRDPGEEGAFADGVEAAKTQLGDQRAKPRWIELGETSILTKWCPTCQTYRPPRTSHCRLCNNCVEQSDHHCTFLNNCIGRRNYFSFLVFLASATLLVSLSISLALVHIVAGPSGAGLVIGSYVVVGLSVIVGGPVVGLAVFHGRLVLRNLTTIETLRTRGMGFGADEIGLHSLGSVWENCIYVGCRPGNSLSWIRPSAHATCDLRP